mgnify:CR=1 FL=1
MKSRKRKSGRSRRKDSGGLADIIKKLKSYETKESSKKSKKKNKEEDDDIVKMLKKIMEKLKEKKINRFRKVACLLNYKTTKSIYFELISLIYDLLYYFL